MLASSLMAGAQSAQPAAMGAPAQMGSPAQTEKYIAGTWSVLTRSMRDCKTVVDPKLPSATVLYIPADRPEPPETKQLATECHVQVDRLPRKITGFGQLKLTDIPRQGLLYLPNDYVVPGGRFNEMYGWDSYFIVLGLVEAGKVDLARGMVENFFYEIDNYGGILNANRTYYLTRSQPPYLSSMIQAVYDAQHDDKWLARAYGFARRDHALWESSFHRAGNTGLARYYDIGSGPVPEMSDDDSYYSDVIRYIEAHPASGGEQYLVSAPKDPTPAQAAELARTSCDGRTSKVCANAWVAGKRLTADFYKGDRAMRESGFDPSFRFGVFDGSTHHYAPNCLNSLLYKYELDMAHFAALLHKPAEEAMWKKTAAARKAAIDKYLWNAKAGMYFDYDYMAGKQSTYKYITTFDPLWSGEASRQQAAGVLAHLPDFEHKYGVAMSTTDSGVQWDLPYGWAPTHWPTVEGLLNYGYKSDALRVAGEWNGLIDNALARSGFIKEKYDVVSGTGELAIQTGYKTNEIGFGWTNAVYLKFAHLLDDNQKEGKQP
jgi:alpha,alpha-trehalase